MLSFTLIDLTLRHRDQLAPWSVKYIITQSYTGGTQFGSPGSCGRDSRKYQKSSWKYGDIEFHFVAGTDCLFVIHLDEFDVPSDGRSINLDPWVIRRALLLGSGILPNE